MAPVDLPTHLPSRLPMKLPSRGNFPDRGFYGYQGEFLHVLLFLPGITLQVLHLHLYKDYLLPFCKGLPVEIAPHPTNPFGFVITVHHTHDLALSIAQDVRVPAAKQLHFLGHWLDSVYLRQAVTPSRRIYRQLPPGISLPTFQRHLSHNTVFSNSRQPYTVISIPHIPNGIIVTVCLGNYVAINEDVIDAALVTVIPPPQAHRYLTYLDPNALQVFPPAGNMSTPTPGTKPGPKVEPEPASTQHLAAGTTPVATSHWSMITPFWMLSQVVLAYIAQLYYLFQLLEYSRASTAPAPDLCVHPTGTLASPVAKLTLLTPHRRLWKPTTATPQVSLPGILGMIVLLSTIMQHNHPRIYPSTYRSSPRSSVSSGLRWRLALHARAMATAWDLITQTHLMLWGWVQYGIRPVA